ncbi:MAG: AAA family ATPase [Nitrospinae bacterium]|nr:AAA family ATPase [Nitrospinota bacterium]
MILERLELERVRRFSPRFACNFGPGLNAVVGPNESGKSTIFKSLEAALFWDPKSSREEVRSLYAWGDERPFAIRLHFRSGDLNYRLWKDFHSKEILLEEQPTGKVWRDAKSALGQIEDLLGMKTPEVFAASAAVAQGQLVLPERGKGRKALEEALANAMTGGGEGGGAERAIELLDKNIQNLTIGLKDKAYKTPGPIKAAEERLASLQGRYREVALIYAQRVSDQRALKAAERELLEVAGALDAKQSLLAVETERRKLQDSLNEHKERYSEIERRHWAFEKNAQGVREADKALEGLGSAALLEAGGLTALRGALERRDILTTSLKEARKALKDTPVPSLWGQALLGVLGIAALLAPSMVSPWLKLGATVLGAVALAVATWLWYRRAVARRVLGDRRAEATRREAELEEVEERLGELSHRAGVTSPEETLRRAEKAARIRDERERLLSEREGLLGGRSAEALGAERSELLRKMAVLEERLSEERFGGPALDPEKFAEIGMESEKLAVSRDKLTKQVDRLMTILEISFDQSEGLAELEEAIDAAEREFNRHRRSLQVRELAKTALEESRQAAIGPAAKRFQEILGRYVSKMSVGRYTEVRLGTTLSALEVLGPEREDFVRSQELSFGAAEQLLLAARLTLTELLAGNKRTPLLLDEPFGSFDERRLGATMKLLSSIAQQRQVILFTHHEAVASVCDHVVVLPPPSGSS